MARSICSHRGVAAIRLYAVKCRARTENAPSVFSIDSDGSFSDPHQSPFWIKTLGLLPLRVDTRSLAPQSPRKTSVPCSCPSAAGASFSAPPGWRNREVPRDGWHRARGSVFTDLWLTARGRLQPLGGSGQRRISQNLLFTAFSQWMRRRPIRPAGFGPTPFRARRLSLSLRVHVNALFTSNVTWSRRM